MTVEQDLEQIAALGNVLAAMAQSAVQAAERHNEITNKTRDRTTYHTMLELSRVLEDGARRCIEIQRELRP